MMQMRGRRIAARSPRSVPRYCRAFERGLPNDRLAIMSKKRTSRKSQKKRKPTAANKLRQRAKVAAKKKTPVKSKTSPKKKTVKRQATIQVGSQSVETVSLKPKGRGTRAGAGAGDFQGVSARRDVDFESAKELLEEGQAFEAGVVSGVENAGNADETEVTTHEVPQDDVPGEYNDKDRP